MTFALAHNHPVRARHYRIERDTLRVTGVCAEPWFAWLAGITMAIAAIPTHGITLVLLPVTIGFLRNRPMLGILFWDVFLSAILVGWIVAFVKACGNH